MTNSCRCHDINLRTRPVVEKVKPKEFSKLGLYIRNYGAIAVKYYLHNSSSKKSKFQEESGCRYGGSEENLDFTEASKILVTATVTFH